MLRLPSTFNNVFVAIGVALCLHLTSNAAHGQACCAGPGAITPARLRYHESALVGLQARNAIGFGSFTSRGAYVPTPKGASDYEFQQDLFGGLRLASKVQIALLIPFVEARRQSHGHSEFGGSIGDMNASARVDFIYAGESSYVPGIAALAGLIVPTGTPPESAKKPLGTDATGTGAWQGSAGLSLEQVFDRWLVSASVLLAQRSPRSVNGLRSTLGLQVSTIAALAYAFESGHALALVLSETFEGNATVNDQTVPNSARRATLTSLAGLLRLSNSLRLQGSLFLHPPVEPLGKNTLATAGLTATLLHAW